MAADRTERLLNLVLCLLGARQPVSRARIRDAVPGYAQSASDESFERMFERDKEELRAMGIPLETVVSAGGDVEGYRIDTAAYALPEIPVTAGELAVLGLAARAWTDAALESAARTALRKIEAASGTLGDVSPSPIPVDLVAQPHPGETQLPSIWQAVREHRVLEFDYRARGRGSRERRSVEPWGTVHWSGAWYLVGWDRDRSDERVFRLSRIEGSVAIAGRAHENRPARADLRPIVAELEGVAPAATRGTIELARGEGARLRLVGEEVEVGPTDDPRFDRIVVEYADESVLAAEIAGLGDRARALDPPNLVDAVRARLVSARDAHGGRP